MRRGEVYWAELAPRSGSEQSGRRPVVIVSHDGFNQSRWQSVIVVPASTSPLQAKRGPTVVPVPGGAAGLAKPCTVVCHQVTTLDRSKIGRRIGVLPSNLLQEVDRALHAALGLVL